REAVRAALARHQDADAAVAATLRARGCVSFPHTTLFDSAEPIARVAQSIVAMGAQRVVALGVLHGSTLPEPYRVELARFQRGGPDAETAFARLAGAFVNDGPART